MIFVECDADEAFVKTLGITPQQLRHENGRSGVIAAVYRHPGAVGLVDEDPQTNARPSDWANYQQQETRGHMHRLVRNDQSGRSLIVLCPNLEGWMYHRAKANAIDPGQYSLPTDPKVLHSIPRYELKHDFRRFLYALRDQDANIHLLQQWLRTALE